MNDKDWRDFFPQYGYFGKYSPEIQSTEFIVSAIIIICILIAYFW